MEKYDMLIELQGRILSKRKSNKGDVGSIILDTTASAKDPRVHNTPHVMFFSNVGKLDRYERGDFVCVKGYFGTYVDKSTKKRKQSIVATDISPAKSKIAREYEGQFSSGPLCDKINQFRLVGSFIGKQDNGGISNLFVRVVKNGHPATVLLKVYRRDYVDEILNSIKPGDTVCTVGTVQTKFTKKKGKKTYYENAIAMEIVKVE